MTSLNRNARELLAFYRDAGVDALLGDEPVDRFADDLQSVPPPERARTDSGAVRVGVSGSAARTDPSPDRPRRSDPPLSGEGKAFLQSAAPPSAEAAVMSARAAAKSAESLDALRALLQTFEGCMLRSTATQLVFADGNPKGRVMFVGE